MQRPDSAGSAQVGCETLAIALSTTCCLLRTDLQLICEAKDSPASSVRPGPFAAARCLGTGADLHRFSTCQKLIGSRPEAPKPAGHLWAHRPPPPLPALASPTCCRLDELRLALVLNLQVREKLQAVSCNRGSGWQHAPVNQASAASAPAARQPDGPGTGGSLPGAAAPASAARKKVEL